MPDNCWACEPEADGGLEYDDGDGDFHFSRGGVRKVQQKPVEATRPMAGEKEPEPPKPKPKVKKMLPTTPIPAEKKPKRRSARISGEKDQIQMEQPKSPANMSNDKENPTEGHHESPSLTNGTSPLRIGKREDATKIALPFADTPINKRNKELRKGHRRSSTGIRGRRASSLIDSGTSNGA